NKNPPMHPPPDPCVMESDIWCRLVSTAMSAWLDDAYAGWDTEKAMARLASGRTAERILMLAPARTADRRPIPEPAYSAWHGPTIRMAHYALATLSIPTVIWPCPVQVADWCNSPEWPDNA